MSSRELIARYVAERARLRVFVPLALVIAAVDRWTGGQVDGWNGGRSASDFAVVAVTALALALAFRIWDDIEDRSRDAREHPNRVTVVAESIAPLIAVAIALAVAGLALIAFGPRAAPRLGVVGAATAVISAWYRLRPVGTRGVINGHVVMLKYPALAFAVSPAAPPFAALASLYLVLCVYEIVDDPSLRASLVARRIAISECALVSMIIATATLLGGRLS